MALYAIQSTQIYCDEDFPVDRVGLHRDRYPDDLDQLDPDREVRSNAWTIPVDLVGSHLAILLGLSAQVQKRGGIAKRQLRLAVDQMVFTFGGSSPSSSTIPKITSMVTIEVHDPHTIGFTSDWHLGHKRCREYREFETFADMHNAILGDVRKRFGAGTTLFNLGDFTFWPVGRTRDEVQDLECEIIMTRGNHDSKSRKTLEKIGKPIASIHDVLRVRVYDEDLKDEEYPYQDIFLSHYAHRVWPDSHHGSWHLYGHSHGNLEDDPHARSIDVGVDTNKMQAYTYWDLKEIMGRKDWKPVDHHGDSRPLPKTATERKSLQTAVQS